MGSSGIILKKRENVDLYQTIEDVKNATKKVGLMLVLDELEYRCR